MSTNDVPGAKSANNDELNCGCWAEHEDNSLIFVYSTEGDEAVYSLFDPNRNPVQEFRDKMPIDEFKKYFSWDGNNNSVKWTWHDKTAFPWDKLISAGARDGVLPSASAHDQLTESKNVVQMLAKALGIVGNEFDENAISHLASKDSPRKMINVIQEGINECPAGKSKSSKKMKKLLKKQEKIQEQIAALAE